MPKTARIFLLFFFFSQVTLASTSDSAKITPEMLTFSSPYEKQHFEQLHKTGKFDTLGFLFCLDSTITESSAKQLQNKLNSFFDTKLTSAVNKKSSDKTLKNIFRLIHDDLLTKYLPVARFERLLDIGEYNCVTASALYALAFDRFHIRYQIRSTTDHVYIIANPGPEQMVIESTDPQNGVIYYTDQYKTSYLEILHKQKVISRDEFYNNPTDVLFQKYFLKSDTINWRQLVSYHYYNDGVVLQQEEKYEQAVNQLMKAHYLHPTSQTGYMLYVNLANVLNRHFDIEDTALLKKYFLMNRLVNEENDLDFLYNKYAYLTQELCIHNEDLPTYKRITQLILSNISDSSFCERVQQLHHYGMAVNYGLKEEVLSALYHIIIAHCINPKDLSIKKFYDDLINDRPYGFAELEEEQLDSLISLTKQAGQICGRANTIKPKLQFTMIKVAQLFSDDKDMDAYALLSAIEKEAKENSITDFEDRYVELMCTSAFGDYYSGYNIPKAKEILARGLQLDPNNKLIQEKLKRIDTLKDVPPFSSYNNYSPPKKPSSSTPRTVIVKPGK